MPTYTVARAVHANLTAGLFDTVVFSAVYARVTVVNRSSANLYVTTDGTNAAIAADDCLLVPAMTAAVIPVLSPVNGTAPETTTVSLISGVAAAYSVSVSDLTLVPLTTGTAGTTDVAPPTDSGLTTTQQAQVQALINTALIGR